MREVDDTCGSWQEEYSSIHRLAWRCLSNDRETEAPESCQSLQYLVFRSREGFYRWKYSGGIAGRMAGLLTTFTLALGSSPMKAFFIDWPGSSTLSQRDVNAFGQAKGIFHALQSPGDLDFKFDQALFDAARIPVLWNKHDFSHVEDLVNDLDPFCGTNQTACLKDHAGPFMPRHRHFGSVLNASMVIRTVDGGVTTLLGLERANFSSRLHALGLRTPHAYRCLFEFLFKPTPRLHAMYGAEWAALRASNSIAMQIRMGYPVISAERLCAACTL